MNLKSFFVSVMRTYIIPITVVILLSVLQTGCSEDEYSTSNSNATPGTNEIFMKNTAFTPVNKTISVGTTLTWKNQDNFAHTVTSGTPGNPSGLFDSGNLGSGGTFSFTFNSAGSFKYFCSIHSSMTGTITVQ
jgi:plastocyanin